MSLDDNSKDNDNNRGQGFFFPPGLKVEYLPECDFLQFFKREQQLIADRNKLLSELRNVSNEKQITLQEISSQSKSRIYNDNDEFQAILDKKNEASRRMEEIRLEQAKVSSSRDEIDLIGYEIRPIEKELNDYKTRLKEAVRNEQVLRNKQETLQNSFTYKTISEVDAEIEKIENKIEEIRRTSSTVQNAQFNAISNKKLVAEKAKKDIMNSYQMDERIEKEISRQVILKKQIEEKEAQLNSLQCHKEKLRLFLDNLSQIKSEYEKLKEDVIKYNKELDKIQIKRKEKSNMSNRNVPTEKSTLDRLNHNRRQIKNELDKINEELDDIHKKIENKHKKIVNFNPEYRRHIVGRNGVTLDTLMRDFGVAVFLDGRNNEGKAIIYGEVEAIEGCTNAIEQIVSATKSFNMKETISFVPNLSRILIGPKGSNVIQIQNESGAKIKVNGDTIEITGTQEAIDSAKKIINDFIDANTTDEINFDPSITEIIIGKGGKTIRHIEQESGVKNIRVDKNKNIIIFTGNKENVEMAKSRYADLISSMTKNVITIPANNSIISTVIGFQGKTIRKIQEKSGATVETISSGNNHCIVIRGEKENVETAKKLIDSIAFREEVSVPFNSYLYTYLMQPANNQNNVDLENAVKSQENLSPLEAIREQSGCDQINALKVEGKIVIRGSSESVKNAKTMVEHLIQTSIPHSIQIQYPQVLFNYLTKRNKELSVIDKFKQNNSNEIINVEIERNNKYITVIAHPKTLSSDFKLAVNKLEDLINELSVIRVSLPPRKAGNVIGRGGEVIKNIQNSTSTSVYVDRESGEVQIFSVSNNKSDLDSAIQMITSVCTEK